LHPGSEAVKGQLEIERHNPQFFGRECRQRDLRCRELCGIEPAFVLKNSSSPFTIFVLPTDRRSNALSDESRSSLSDMVRN